MIKKRENNNNNTIYSVALRFILEAEPVRMLTSRLLSVFLLLFF